MSTQDERRDLREAASSCEGAEGPRRGEGAVDEGVIKFRAAHRHVPLPASLAPLVDALSAWRQRLVLVGAVGEDPTRYGGAGFGNLSARIAGGGEAGRDAFVITGTQTGGVARLDPSHFCVVTACEPARNAVTSFGPCLPSSEAMTHGALYELGADIRFVFHGHAPSVWRRRRELGMPETGPDVPYGSAEMAEAVAELHRRGAFGERPCLAMAGHEDGVVTFGASADEAGEAFLALVERASR